MFSEFFVQGKRERVHILLRIELDHEFTFFSNDELAMCLYYLQHLGWLHGPPATGSQQEFSALERPGRFEIYGSESGVPPDLSRFSEYRAYRVMIDATSTKKTETHHLNASSKTLEMSG